MSLYDALGEIGAKAQEIAQLKEDNFRLAVDTAEKASEIRKLEALAEEHRARAKTAELEVERLRADNNRLNDLLPEFYRRGTEEILLRQLLASVQKTLTDVCNKTAAYEKELKAARLESRDANKRMWAIGQAADAEIEHLKQGIVADEADLNIRISGYVDERDQLEARRAASEEQWGRWQRECDRLRKWVADLQSGMWVNCVYCGHRYGPGETHPVSMADALKAHINVCPDHPMSKLRAEYNEQAGYFQAANARINRLTDKMIQARVLVAEIYSHYTKDAVDKADPGSQLGTYRRALACIDAGLEDRDEAAKG